MKREVMEKWYAALHGRVGNYKQGRDKLKKKDSKGIIRHCCLGVLCELYNQEHKNNKYKFTDKEDEQLLPPEVQEWAGMNSNDGEIKNMFGITHAVNEAGLCKLEHREHNYTLSEFNDKYKFKFHVLANLIRIFYTVI